LKFADRKAGGKRSPFFGAHPFAQGCQICLGAIYQNGEKIITKYTKWQQNIPNGNKTYQMVVKYSQNTNIFYSKALQNLPKFGFLVRKYMYHLATLRSRPNRLWKRVPPGISDQPMGRFVFRFDVKKPS
jgi:hypothetical protein